MAYRSLDWFDAAAPWTARAPDGTPSAEITAAAAPEVSRFGDGPSLRIDATADAEDHRLERSITGEDFTADDELRLWLHATRVGDGAPGRPLYLETALAGPAMAFDDAANTWRRRLPVRQAGAWQLVRLALDDLPAPLRADVDAVRLRCVDESLAFTLHLDAPFAARPEMVADVEAALLARLDGILTVGGAAVSALLYHAEGAAPPPPPAGAALPALRLRHVGLAPAADARAALPRHDYTGDGFRTPAEATVYDLVYLFEPFCATRAEEAALIEAVLRAMGEPEAVVAGGVPVPTAWEGAGIEALLGERLALRYRLRARLVRQTGRAVVPVDDVTVEVEFP